MLPHKDLFHVCAPLRFDVNLPTVCLRGQDNPIGDQFATSVDVFDACIRSKVLAGYWFRIKQMGGQPVSCFTILTPQKKVRRARMLLVFARLGGRKAVSCGHSDMLRKD
jgi:hypothetical protein